MKNKVLLSVVFTSVTMILLVSAVTADPNDRGDHHGTPGMPGPMPDRPSPHHMEGGMNGGSDYMNVTGSVSVDDGVIISLSISPNTARAAIEEHRGETPPNFTNSINVTLYEMVEFEDLGEQGYDVNDTIVSVYALNSSTLGDVKEETIEGKTSYSVSSDDGVFSLIVEVNVTDNIPHDWKWSLKVTYPFDSSTSSLALVHDVESSRMNMVDPMHMHAHRGRPGDDNFKPGNFVRYHNNSRVAQSEHIPIVFSWDTTVLVDGSIQEVIATSFGDAFALTIPQGATIDYDPRLSMNTNAINALDQELYLQFDGRVSDIINSPTYLGLGIGLVLTSLMIFVYSRR